MTTEEIYDIINDAMSKAVRGYAQIYVNIEKSHGGAPEDGVYIVENGTLISSELAFGKELTDFIRYHCSWVTGKIKSENYSVVIEDGAVTNAHFRADINKRPVAGGLHKTMAVYAAVKAIYFYAADYIMNNGWHTGDTRSRRFNPRLAPMSSSGGPEGVPDLMTTYETYDEVQILTDYVETQFPRLKQLRPYNVPIVYEIRDGVLMNVLFSANVEGINSMSRFGLAKLWQYYGEKAVQ